MTTEQWQTYSLAYQMGNIGSEVSRMVSLKAKGRFADAQAAYERSLELLDMTIADRRWQSGLGELTRLTEVLRDYITDSKEYNVSGTDLNNYFLPFALMARK